MIVKRIDLGICKVLANAKKIDGRGVKVGLMGTETGEDGTRVVDIAVYNEYGTGRIPPRPFMRTFAAKGEVKQVAAKLGQKVNQGIDVTAILTTLGAWYAQAQKDHVIHSSWTPNAPSTIRKKGSAKPLIDTGQMVNAITWKTL